MDWKDVYAASRPHILRGARARALWVSGIGAFILTIAAIVAPFDWRLGAAIAFIAVIVGAFWREARQNASTPPLVLVGRVVDKGLRKFTDSGGPGDVAATRIGVSPQITLAVHEAFDLAADGTRAPRPDEQKEHVIQQLRWYRELEPGEDIILVCLPRSTDPVFKVPRQ